MANPKGSKGFIVVTPTGIIEIPQDSYLSWLTMFYLMPRVLVEKWHEALKIPRKPFKALRSQACLDIIKQDMFAELVWDCWSWTAWQAFQVKDSRGNYGEIPGSREQYTGYFPLWQLSYDILRYFRRKIEREYISFQMLYTAGPDDEMPWFTYREFGNLVGNLTDLVVKEENWQPTSSQESATERDKLKLTRTLCSKGFSKPATRSVLQRQRSRPVNLQKPRSARAR